MLAGRAWALLYQTPCNYTIRANNRNTLIEQSLRLCIVYKTAIFVKEYYFVVAQYWHIMHIIMRDWKQ